MAAPALGAQTGNQTGSLSSPEVTSPEQGGGSISGTVTDPSAALIPRATITLAAPGRDPVSVTANTAGRYTLNPLPPGTYTLTAESPGFAPKTLAPVQLLSGQRLTLDVRLAIATQQQQVEVNPEDGPADPAHNADAIVLKGHALDTLSSDTSLMLQQLQAMAGSGGDGSPQIYVDGFSGGKIPPKASIREIRINQNPYSAEYDAIGYGRIEIFTKPGSDQIHGDVNAYGSDSALDSRNPYSPLPQPFYTVQVSGDLSGPITKKSSFFLSGSEYKFSNSSIVNAVLLDPAFNQVSFSDAIASPSSTLSLAPRFDAQLSPANTLSLRYQLDRTSQTNAGVGQFALRSQAFNTRTTTSTLQLSDTQTFGPKIVNELRFQYIRTRAFQDALSSAPALVVQGAFTGGGNNLGRFSDNQDSYEIQNYSSVDLGKHFLRFGVRQRLNRDSNRSTANYNGEYIFSTLTAYQLTEQGIADGLTPAEIRASGGGASQFNITAGNPSAAILVADTGLYAEDTWKARKNLTLTFGLRFETQNHIHDRADFAPRLAFSYGIGGTDKKSPAFTLHGGFGIFYTRLPSSNILTATRQDGIHQQQFVLTSPDTYPDIPDTANLNTATSPTIFRISPGFHAPYSMQGSLALDRTLGKHGRVSGTYTTTRGVHQLLSRNINAPLPGTYDPADPSSGVRPLGGTQNLYQYESTGLSRQNSLGVNTNLSGGEKYFIYGNYFYSFRRSDTSGGFPSNQYDIRQDYGRSTSDYRHTMFLGAYFQFPFHFNGGPFVTAHSSAPFNIVLGQDINGDSQFNDRPSFATDLSRPSVVRTAYGNFDTQPIAGQRIIPINYGNGPGLALFNLYFGRSLNFGPAVKQPEGAPPPAPVKGKAKPIERRYTLQFAAEANNIFNHVNPAPPVGTLGSPLFGRSNALASFFSQGSANRTIDLQVFFRF